MTVPLKTMLILALAALLGPWAAQAAPPAEAADAFRGVAGARADAIRLVNEAEGYANDLIPRARGEAYLCRLRGGATQGTDHHGAVRRQQ